MESNFKMMLVVATFVLMAAGSAFGAGTNIIECVSTVAFTGEAIGDRFGSSVASAGDVNGDGFSDIIVGAYKSDAAGQDAGKVYVYSGQSGGLLYSYAGDAAGEWFGRSVDGAGDVNNDGYDDFIAVALNHDFGGFLAGRVYVYSGQSGLLLYSLDGAVNEKFGYSASGAGDVNNDGYADLIVGATYASQGGVIAGCAYVYSGQTGALLQTFTGETSGDRLGHSVSGAGDVDNDGFADLIVGAPLNDAGGAIAGRAYVYSGQSGELLHVLTGEVVGKKFGYAVSGAGDVNNDGFADLMVGAPFSSPFGEYGSAQVYSGQTGELLHILSGSTQIPLLGIAVSDVGDIDNDGIADLIVGSSFDQANAYSGQTGELLRAIVGGALAGGLGESVSSAGDVNGDGNADVLIGAPSADSGVGRVYLYLLGVACCVVPGDANGDGIFNIADITFGISRVFGAGSAPSCPDEADANGDNTFNISDITFGIARVFAGGPLPVCGSACAQSAP